MGVEARYSRTEGAMRAPLKPGPHRHTETAISGDTRADWSEAFALVPSLDVAYVWHATRKRFEE